MVSATDVRRAFRKSIATAVQRCERKLAVLADDADQTTTVQLQECGEILKANLTVVKRGQSEIVLPDPFHSMQPRTIVLDPALGPLDNTRKYFKASRKRADGAAHIAREQESCRKETEALKLLKERFSTWDQEAGPDLMPPADLVAEGARCRIHVEGLPVAATTGASPLPEGVRRFLSRDGLEIWVGRTAEDNDRLSLRLARGNDWWMHVAHQTGSHVVIRMGGENRPLPGETRLDAAHLAVFFSKARKAAWADVTLTQAKHVRKRSGSPAGQVLLESSESVAIRIDAERLTRLLKGDGEQR